jgi:hypothetical protein
MPTTPTDMIPERRVHVYVTKEVAFSLEKMNKVTKAVLGRLGCDNCHSGRLIDFHIIEDFVVNPKTLDVTELPGGMGRF